MKISQSEVSKEKENNNIYNFQNTTHELFCTVRNVIVKFRRYLHRKFMVMTFTINIFGTLNSGLSEF